MKGLVPVTRLQANNGIFWSGQDQNYLPRLMNYLNMEFKEYCWEIVPIYELTEERMKTFDAVAITPLSNSFYKRIHELNRDIKMIRVNADKFMRQIAPKAAVIGRTTGYVLANGTKMSQKRTPKEKEVFTYDNLRQVMRDYPTIYWQVLSIEELTERLNQHSKNVTVGLIPETYDYEADLEKNFPEVKILKLRPKPLEEIPKVYEIVMILTGTITMLLMVLRVFF
ncbi:hypothetical protein [Enterococcus rivorum]|uniref:Uncharacterized protein n=1 Tax=Enterococcus rivorum TaxID=762845 RepID=A0A1E5KSS8_9ENTE|nr:hypothetical protein [Enterococcus rivorum]MBP2098252.1 hypothetical protein [Enterococcus rivorum]OEH80828.1 hypothetical protein BCR26_06245 [Enterococcus rivorum]